MKSVYSFLFTPLFLLLIFAIFIPQARAQNYNYPVNPYLLPQTDPNVPQNTHTLVQSIFIDILSTISCYLTGVDSLTQSHNCLGPDLKTGKLGYISSNGGAIGLMALLIGNTYNLPIHSSQYINYLSQSFHGASEHSYAQNEIGAGAKGLDPILNIWIGFRNIAYLFIVIIFIIIGLGIMLRIKIDPRTVMTIQNTIPKVIIGLLLITFSFAIAGLLIDMMYVLTFLLLNVISNASGDPAFAKIVNSLTTTSNPYDAVNSSFAPVGGIWGPIAGATNLIATLVSTAFQTNIVGQVISIVLGFMGDIPDLICSITHIFGSTGTCVPGGIYGLVSLVVGLALFIAVFAALFRFWIALVNCYINILFAVILGPLRLLLGMVPSNPGGGVGGWFRDLIANLLVFPVCLAFIALTGELAKSLGNATTGSTAFTFAMLPGFNIGQMISLVAMIAILPKLPSSIQEMFKTKDVFGPQFGAALGGGIKTITRGVSSTIATVAPTPRPGEKGGPWIGIQQLIR